MTDDEFKKAGVLLLFVFSIGYAWAKFFDVVLLLTK